MKVNKPAMKPAEVIAVNPADTVDDIVAKAANIVPSPRQLEWQRLEQTAFIHFGMNTFTGKQIGNGREGPTLFRPDNLDTDQWATTLKNTGFKQAILTTKHHDGFLLFPSNYSGHSVASSTWKGDVVRSFADSMRKAGLRIGFYLSPADLNAYYCTEIYANGSKRRNVTIPSNSKDISGGHTFGFSSDDYNTYYENTLYELLTRYGEIHEVWLDGYHPAELGDHYQEYDFANWVTMIRTLQPNAVVFQDGGPDVRWVGNESVKPRTAEWSPLPYTGDPATAADTVLTVQDGNSTDDLGSVKVLGRRKDGKSTWNMLRWAPAECDATLDATQDSDGGIHWFWHTNDKWRTVEELETFYYDSVGRNCNLLLNVPPNKHGLFEDEAVQVLTAFHARLSSTFTTNLATGAKAENDNGTVNTEGHTPACMLDTRLDTSWQPTEKTGAIKITLPKATTFDVISLQEDLAIGQRVETFVIESWSGKAWTTVAEANVIGAKRLVRLNSPVTANQIRLRITGSRAEPGIATFGLFLRPTKTSTGTPNHD
ncbi:alpha-L-fucosidase [Kitasatospora sp. NPDC127067]|uniref:alpha-L-fucosidase n=1 Tax=Kitasatospora sp. NPDC127067 TaxID=3347126 RepID=UPI0036610233